MKKIVLIIVAMLAAMTASATAIWVNGNKITGDKTLNTGGGKVVYTSANKRLTVTGVTFNRSGSDNNGIDNQDVDGLTIVFTGTNSMTIENADVLNLRAKTTVVVSSGTTTLTCNAGGQNAIKARGADVTVSCYAGAVLNLVSSNGPAIEGKNGTEQVNLHVSKCNIRSSRQDFYNLGVLSITLAQGMATRNGITSSMEINLAAKTSTDYAHADKIGKWDIGAYLKMREPDFGVSIDKLTDTKYSRSDVVMTDEHVDSSIKTVDNFLFTEVTYDGETCAKLLGPTIKSRHSKPTSVIVPGFVTVSYVRPVIVGDSAFSVVRNPNWTSLSDITFEFGVKAIGKNALDRCSGLSDVRIPSSVKSIDRFMLLFAGNSTTVLNLYWATLDPKLVDFTANSFVYSNAKETVVWFPTFDAISKANKLESVTEYLTVAETRNPENCYDLSGNGNNYVVTKWDMTTAAGEMTLVGGTNTKFDLTDSNDYVDGLSTKGTAKRYYCTAIAADAYIWKSNLKSVNISSSHVKTIGDEAFSHCAALTSVVVGNGVETIGIKTFDNCAKLGSVNIQAKSIGKNAFRGCVALTTAILGDNVATIDDCAFYECGALKKVEIGKGVSSIGMCSFCYCNLLSTIDCGIEDPQSVTYGIDIFKYVDKTSCVLNIPAGTLALYKDIYPWNEFLNIVDPDPAVIGDVNGDKAVNAGDVSAVYNVMLGITTDEAVIGRADVNGDTSVNAGDVSAVYNIMLAK